MAKLINELLLLSCMGGSFVGIAFAVLAACPFRGAQERLARAASAPRGAR
jgi:hypothetical protein